MAQLLALQAGIEEGGVGMAWRSRYICGNFKKWIADGIVLTGKALRPWRQQDLPFPKWQNRVSLPPTQEPSPDCMDRPFPETAQEGYL